MEMKAVCMAPVISGGVWKAFQNFRANQVNACVFIIWVCFSLLCGVFAVFYFAPTHTFLKFYNPVQLWCWMKVRGGPLANLLRMFSCSLLESYAELDVFQVQFKHPKHLRLTLCEETLKYCTAINFK